MYVTLSSVERGDVIASDVDIAEMPEIELSAGAVKYEDTGGEGPPIVLLHGLLMTSSLWDRVVDQLHPDFRCIRPTMPMGAHRRPMRPQADLSLEGQVRLLVELLDRLDVEEATLIFNDWCGAQLLIAEGWDRRVARLVFASCETYDNYPPGLPGKVAGLAARIPGGYFATLKPLRLKPLRRLPLTFGLMSKRPIPDGLMDEWLEPASSQARSGATSASTPATRGREGDACARRTRAWRASANRCWWPGRPRTG